ncbi:nucleoporin NUP100/NSP100, putative [Plasmodium ovale]|uniref:Nucleoporin NUP100/NSP100, putative n=1 Tax=Plasmodium ovale TaxID=36330 RepID=A0A1C3KQ97_PLAOA|nr:nucleoporin NUP100/NSP100, putative [Plasmodium ovale]
MFMQNSSSNNLFGSFNNQGNNSNKGIFGNANVQSNMSGGDHSSLFGSSKAPQTNNALMTKNIFNMGSSSGGLGTGKSLYDSMNNQSSVNNKSIFGTTSGVSSTTNQGNLGGNNLFMNTTNQSNLSMKNIFGGTSNMNTQGSNLGNKNIFGGLQQNNQNTTSNSLFGNLSSTQTNSGNMFGSLSSTNQNKGNSLFGTSQTTNQSSSTGNMFGNSSSLSQNKPGGLFGALQTANQTSSSSSSSMFGGLSVNQAKSTTGSNIFGGLSTSTGTNTGAPTSSLFGNTSSMSQNKPGGLFGNLQSSTQNTTSSSMFGNASGMNQNKGSSLFSSFSTPNQTSTTSNNIFGNSAALSQNKPGGLFGALQTANQTSGSSNIFGNTSGMTQNKGSNLFGGISTGTGTTSSSGSMFGNAATMNQNKPGGVFGTLSSSSQNASNSNMFGSLSVNQTKPTTGVNLFGGISSSAGTNVGANAGANAGTNTGANTGTSTNSLFGNTLSGNQSKTSTNIFGSMPTSTQPASGNIFGSTASTNQGMTNNVFSSTIPSTPSQNKFGNIFGTVGTPSPNSGLTPTIGSTCSATPAIVTPSTLGMTSPQGSSSSNNIFGNVSTGMSNTSNLGDNKNIFGTSSGFSLTTANTSVNPITSGIGLGTNLSAGLSPNLGTNMNTGTSTSVNSNNMFGNIGGGLNTNLGSNITSSTNFGTTGLGTPTTSGTKSLFSNNQNGVSNNVINTQEKMIIGEKGKDINLMGHILKMDKGVENDDVSKSNKYDNDVLIKKKKEYIFDKMYEEDTYSDKEQEGTFYNYINLIINDNINDIQKTTFSLLNDHDSLMWDNFKSNIFKNFVDYLVNFKQKKNQKAIKSNVLDLDQHEFQILIWLYNVNSYKIDFIPFKSFYYLLLSDTNLNYSKMFIGNSEKNICFSNFVEINDHYYMNSKNHFFKSQIGKQEENYLLSKEGNNMSNSGGAVDVDSVYKQILKDILNSLLNMNLSITKENIKNREKEEYYDNNENGKDKINCGNNYVYENLLLNYLLGTLQHLHDKFYKIEISNYVSKDLNQIDEYFVDTKSNEIFSYCYDNFYKNEMDKENCTIHFFFYLVNIMFRCGNYIGLIQIIKNDEFVKNLNIDSYLYDFVILLVRILFLVYNKSNEISIFENSKVDIDCGDILKKKINISNLVNFFHSIFSLCVNNIYAYDLLCVLFSDIFNKKGNMYTNREKKIEMKNIFHYARKKSHKYAKSVYDEEMTIGGSNYSRRVRGRNGSNNYDISSAVATSAMVEEDVFDEENIFDDEIGNRKSGKSSSNGYVRKVSSERYSGEEGGKNANQRRTFLFDMFTNTLQKPKKEKEEEDAFDNIEINEEIDKLNRESRKISNIEILGITNKHGYNFEYCNIETSIWIELTLFISKNFDICGSKFQENFDILDTNLSFYNYDDDNNAFLNDTKYRRERINNKIEKLFICISNCIIYENREYFSVCSKIKIDEVINNFIVVEGKIAEKVRGNISKILKNNFLLYIKLFYYLLLVGNIYTAVTFLSCISNNVQRILLVLTIFLHKNNIFENAQLNNIKMKTLQFLKLKNENNSILYSSHDISDTVPTISDSTNLILLSMYNNDIPFDHFLLKNNNINILLKITYLLNLKTNVSIKLLKSIVNENQDILLNESIIGHINNDGNIFYGKLHDFLFLFKNKVKIRKDIKCFFLMYYVLYKKKFTHNHMLRKKKNENDEEYHYKCRNFKFVQSKNINTLNKISLDNSVISVHSSILYKISQFYAILAYFANQRKNYIISFICYYILKDEQSAINSLIRIYNDELIYYYHNSEKEYGYIRKCAFRFFHLAKNMWPSNVKLESIEGKSYLVQSILFMKRKMFEEAFVLFSSTLIPDNMLEKLSSADYYNIDLSSNFLMTLRELCRKNYKINELVGQTTLRAVVRFLLPIKDKLDAQVVESINYLSALNF